MALPRVGDLLVEAGVVTREQLGEALRHQAAHGGRIGTNLVELGFVDEKTLANFLAKQLSIPSVTAAQIDRIQESVLTLVPAQMAERLKAVPVREDQGRLWVAMADPTDRPAQDEIQRVAKRPVRVLVAPELLIQYALEKFYKVRRQPRIVEVKTPTADLLMIDRPANAGEAPIYQPLNAEAQAVDLEAMTGYIDEHPMPAPVAPARPTLTLQDVVNQLVAATTDEEVLDVAVRFLARDVPRVWVFLIKNGNLASWGGRGLQAAQLQSVKVPLAEAGLVGRALSTGEVLAGRLQPAALGQLALPLGIYAETLGLVLPVRIGKHAVGVICGIDATLDAMRRKPEIEKLAGKLDQALHINYLRRMLQQL